MLVRLFFGLFFCINLLFASLTMQDDYTKEVQVLKSLDIDESFLTDPVFVNMQSGLDRYRTRHFLKVLEDGHTFIPVITKMIADAKIPKAFLYLAMVESKFSAEARSKTRAEGLWQFMPRTARLLGLKVNRYIDERRDPIKSTKVAIKYLKYLHDEFGKWYLAALAYNCGEGTLRRLIKKLGTDKLSVLIDDDKKYLSKETRMYLRKIVMMANLSNDEDFIVKNNAEHLMNRGDSFSLASVKVQGGVSLQSIADAIKVSPKLLKRYNPQLRYFFTPPYRDKKYTIYIPYSKYSLFKTKFKPLKNSKKFYVYRVKKGDNLLSIGKKFGVSYKIIKDFNHLKSSFLKLNQQLIIPSTKPKYIKYTVKRGDTLFFISRKFNVGVKKIMEVNNMKNSFLKPGREIVIPN